MTRARHSTLALLVGALLGGCAGGMPDDPCAGMACAPGRICVQGLCQSVDPTTHGSSDLYPDGAPWGGDMPTSDTLTVDILVPDTLSPDTLAPDMDTGRWYQTTPVSCSTFCGGKGLSNVQSADGGRCVSGEARPQSAIAQGIKFTYGCSSTCTAQSGITTTSVGKYCYRPGQKQDDDSTDLTVGCFCR